MATRNKIRANTAIFGRLDEYCARRGSAILNAGRPRWIETLPTATDRDFLVHSHWRGTIQLSPALAIGCLAHQDRSYFATIGFDLISTPSLLSEEDVTGGVMTTVLSELAIRPTSTTLEVRQVIEAGELGTVYYDGHDLNAMAKLFPPLRLFSTEMLDAEEFASVFLLLCLSDRRRHEHWIDEGLTNALTRMAGASATAIPFELLCRAVLDLDPASLFLALYRSLEALYAREQTLSLMSKLGISKDWIEMAQLLEAHLGWRPREESSLESLLRFASSESLSRVLSFLGPVERSVSSPQSAVAKRIYALRNGLVHYRAFHRSMPFEPSDWSRLCEAMTDLISEVYSATIRADKITVS